MEAVSIFTPSTRGTRPMEVRKTDGDHQFEHLFKTHFKGLHAYATTILHDSSLAEEMVQVVFVKLCERMEKIQIETALESYLYRSIYYESLNHLKHEKVKAGYRTYANRHIDQVSPQPDGGSKRELEKGIRRALNELPEQCRTIFQLSRFEGLKYREIARHLNIAEKTVENQMGKALRILREHLAEFLPVLILYIIQSINRLF